MQTISSKEDTRPYIDPYIVPSSLDDSILLKDASRSYLTPTPFPAPVLKPYDRDATPSSPKPLTKAPKLIDVRPGSAVVIRCTAQHPSDDLSPLIANTSFLRGLEVHSRHSAPVSPTSAPSAYSTSFTASNSCPGSPSPNTARFSPSPTPTPHSPRPHHKRHKTWASGGNFNDNTENLKDVGKKLNLHRLGRLALTPPPPAYTQHAIGQCGGRKDPGAERHWEGRGAGRSRYADGPSSLPFAARTFQ